MKVESLVIADQHAAVNLSTDLVHTARHAEGIGLALIDRYLLDLKEFDRTAVAGSQIHVCGVACERVGSRTAVKS
jgi:hypothetical protein